MTHVATEQLTLGPQYVAGAPIYRNGDQHIATVFNGTEYDARENAAHIVHCVNTHDALVEALEVAYVNSCQRSETNRKWTVKDQEAHEAIRLALLRSRKESVS